MSSPPKQRHRFELLIGDVQRYLQEPNGPDRASRLYTASWNFQRFVDGLVRDLPRTRVRSAQCTIFA
jgi:hypothetical protein